MNLKKVSKMKEFKIIEGGCDGSENLRRLTVF